MRPIVRPTAQPFPVMETRQITVVTANQFAFIGCDPYSFIVGSAIGLEQSGIIRPATVIDSKYDSANTRTLVTVTGRLSASSSLRVWKQDGSDSYYMMNGGTAAVASFIPGGMAAGSAPTDGAITDMGFIRGGRVLKLAGAPTYSTDTTYLGGYPVKVADQQAFAQDAPGGGGLSYNVVYNRGMFLRMGLRIDNVGPGGTILYYRYWHNGGDYKGFTSSVNANRTVAVNRIDYGSSGANYSHATTWTVPALGTWFDFAMELDATNVKIRFWVNGVWQSTFSGTDLGYLGGPFLGVCSYSGANFNSAGGTFSQAASGGAPLAYFHDYLLLNYAPIQADGVTLPVPAKPFSYPGLRAVF